MTRIWETRLIQAVRDAAERLGVNPETVAYALIFDSRSYDPEKGWDFWVRLAADKVRAEFRARNLDAPDSASAEEVGGNDG
jgi:hypothetical protein